MDKFLRTLFLVLISCTFLMVQGWAKAENFTSQSLDPSASSPLQSTFLRTPLHFEANDGQTDPQVQFLSRGNGYSLFLTASEAVLALTKAVPSNTVNTDPFPEANEETRAVLRMRLVGANPSPALANRYLQARGYKEVIEEKDTEVLIYLAYGLTKAKDYLHSYNTHVYGQTGVSSSRTTGTIDSWGNVNASTTYTPDYGIVGSQTHIDTKTIQGGYVALRAIDFQHYLKTKESREVWKTFSMITDSAVDLRKMFPIVMTATEPYIGENTGETVIVSLEKNKDGTFQIHQKGKPHQYEHDSGLWNLLQIQRCPF